MKAAGRDESVAIIVCPACVGFGFVQRVIDQCDVLERCPHCRGYGADPLHDLEQPAPRDC